MQMTSRLQAISPVDGSITVERSWATASDIDAALARAGEAQKTWRAMPLARRQKILSDAVDFLEARSAELASELTWQMGRPIAQAPGEIRGMAERARQMIAFAPGALAPVEPGNSANTIRFIRREPVGIVIVIAPWNYPYLTSVNAVIPALLAGNAVVLKHSPQTPLCAERYAEAFEASGLPQGVFQFLHLTQAATEHLVADARTGFVCFTGSVAGGRAIRKILADRFVGMGLELGGKDPAFVRADADVETSLDALVDGAFFNSGQSCCGIERIYVHADLYESFVDGFVERTRQYRLGDPREASTTLGPLVRTAAADFVRGQIDEAVARGARPLVDASLFAADQLGTPYLAPQVLVDVDHGMRVMVEETFGPVVGLMKVSSDAEAIALMNDSPFGLTASVWSSDTDRAFEIGDQLETGTVFLNRCDHLDPTLAWTGIKNSGLGCTLSVLGYDQLTRPKSFHFRLPS